MVGKEGRIRSHRMEIYFLERKQTSCGMETDRPEINRSPRKEADLLQWKQTSQKGTTPLGKEIYHLEMNQRNETDLFRKEVDLLKRKQIAQTENEQSRKEKDALEIKQIVQKPTVQKRNRSNRKEADLLQRKKKTP